MKQYKVYPPTRKVKTGTETALMIEIQQLCARKKNDMFYVEPNLETLKMSLEAELAKMPRRSVALPTEMFSMVVQHNPRVLRIHKNTGTSPGVWCSVAIVDEEE